MSIVKFDPAEVVQIKIGDLSAPVSVGVELSKLYLASDRIVRELVQDVERNKETGKIQIPPDLLPWFKEQRFLLGEIYKMTGEVEENVSIKKLELQTAVFKEIFKDLPPEERIKIIKAMKSEDRANTLKSK